MSGILIWAILGLLDFMSQCLTVLGEPKVFSILSQKKNNVAAGVEDFGNGHIPTTINNIIAHKL